MHCLPAGLCLPGGSSRSTEPPQPYNPSPVEDFDFNIDMDLTGGGLFWFARPSLFLHCTVCPTGSLGRQSQHRLAASVANARKRAAEILKRHREERGAEYYSSRSLEASEGSVSGSD